MTAGLSAVGLLAITGGVAMAAPRAPKPTVSQVQAKLNKLNAKADKLDNQYDQVQEQLKSANQRLKVVNREAARDQKRFAAMRTEISRIATQAYMQGSLNSSVALLTSGNPQQILDQSSVLLELDSANKAELDQFLSAAHHLTSTLQAARHTRAGIASLKADLAKRKAGLDKLIGQQKSLLSKLQTPVQTSPPSGGLKYTGPTGTQAEAAVAYVYDQVGCPYVFGGNGPCNSGFDCSGLMQQAWGHAGVSIPRVSNDQIADLPQVDLAPGDPTKYLQPGDILGFSGNSHVGMYVGGGMMIDAPHTGLNVQKVPLSGWYLSELDAAVRP
ncbi:MAG TPA: NlpC/P60 family protein [Streptosporangiaceae bacterium]|nr:NlpC/P60 family protein [Streptosporangiaceae bacterium]